MLKLIARHSVPEFFELITGSIEEGNVLGELMVNFLERTLVLRLVENTKELRSDFSYSLLELDTAEEFMRLEYEISPEESYEQWEGFAKESYIKRGQYSQNLRDKREYFDEWTGELKTLTVSLLTGEVPAEVILPAEPLRYWNSFVSQLNNLGGNVAVTA